MAESASVLIIPPCRKPEWLAMSSVVVISATAVPSPVSTRRLPSHAQARDGAACVMSLTARAFRHGHAGRGRARDEPALVVENIRRAEKQRLLHLDDAPHGAKPSLDYGTQEVDLQLDACVPQGIVLAR